MKTKIVFLFRSNIKKLTDVRDNLSMSFDHNHTVMLSQESQVKLRQANELVQQALNILEEIY
jgi:hypothetical protein